MMNPDQRSTESSQQHQEANLYTQGLIKKMKNLQDECRDSKYSGWLRIKKTKDLYMTEYKNINFLCTHMFEDISGS